MAFGGGWTSLDDKCGHESCECNCNSKNKDYSKIYLIILIFSAVLFLAITLSK